MAIDATPERPYLLVFEGGTSSLYHPPSTGTALIGRGEGADLSLKSETVARRHARLVISGDGVTLTDLGSPEGTRVNGVRIESAVLRSGDVVSVGAVTLVLQAPTAARALVDALAEAVSPPCNDNQHRRFRPIADEIRELERGRMIEALYATKHVQTRAAELINMPLRTFVLKLKQYGIARRPEHAIAARDAGATVVSGSSTAH